MLLLMLCGRLGATGWVVSLRESKDLMTEGKHEAIENINILFGHIVKL